MKNLKLITVSVFAVILVSCKGQQKVEPTPAPQETRRDEIKIGVLEGKIKGDTWTFMSGKARKSLLDSNRYTVDLWDTSEKDPCHVFIPTSKRGLLTSFPIRLGTMELGNEQTVTFSFQEDSGEYANLVSTQGTLVIDEISNGVLKGKLVSSFDDKNTVNGSFEVTICQ